MIEIHLYEKTVKEVYEALEKNGFEFIRGSWFIYDKGIVYGGCILGQTGLNLQVVTGAEEANQKDENKYAGNPSLMWKDYDEGRLTIWARSQEVLDAARNDKYEFTLPAQLDKFKTNHPKWRHHPDMGVADCIIEWNDARDGEGGYKLKTYKEVAQMAKDVLLPHFDEKVYLIQLVVPSRPLVAA